MAHSPLFGRRIHIAGSIANSPAHASVEDAQRARNFIAALVPELLKDGATFVVPIDKEAVRVDGQPVCFDWLVLETIRDNLINRPANAAMPLIIAVQHHKNEAQIPDGKRELWESLKEANGLLEIENAGQWNMNSKRMDLQALHGDILITLGGSEGVCHLANRYHHDACRPVIPLNFPITASGEGARKLWELASPRKHAERFFRTADGSSAHDMLNRINFTGQTSIEKKVETLMTLLRALRRPIAFGVRLLNKDIDGFKDVDDFFNGVVKPVVEAEFGYELVVADGDKNEESLITLEIFENLHRSGVVVIDITGERANCFIELGYALARGVSVMVNARQGSSIPFDVQAIPTNKWDPQETLEERKQQFRKYWQANKRRRPIVAEEPLVP